MLFFSLVIIATFGFQAAEKVDVRLEPAGDPGGAFVCEGLEPAHLKAIAERSEEARGVLEVITVPDRSKTSTTEHPSLIGKYRVEGRTLIFQPKYPLDRGLIYRARLKNPPVTFDFELAALEAKGAKAVVKQVSPTSDRLPENLLKFYIEFSQPMSRGEAYKHVHLYNEHDQIVEAPFHELTEELWDARHERFTLLIEPGRIKRGLRPRQELGPVFEEGKSYTLVVDRDWPDANGSPLRNEFRKTFRVGPPDKTSPDPLLWTLEPPKEGTRDPLTVDLKEPLDAALLQHAISIIDANGTTVEGTIALEHDQSQWRFQPEIPWTVGRYRLRVARILEDLAGNSVGRPFEVDETNNDQAFDEEGEVERDWEIFSRPH